MKKPASVVALVLVLAQISLPSHSRACILAVSIWYDVEEAEAIALVRIESLEVHELARGEDVSFLSGPSKRTAATLRVLEKWKGDVPATIDVDLGENDEWSPLKVGDVFVAFLGSGLKSAARERDSRSSVYSVYTSMLESKPEGFPDDPSFPRSREELDRMRRNDDIAFDAFERWMANRWSMVQTMSLDENPEEADLETTRDLIHLAVNMQADGADDAARLDWHVTAAERRATRREGLRELFDLLEFPIPPMETNAFEDDSNLEADAWEPEESAADDSEPPIHLTQGQLQRLAEGFAREPAVGPSDLTMLRLLASYPDLEVDRTAASVIEAGLLLRPIPEWVLEMVEEALKRYGDNFTDRIGRDDIDSRGRPISTGAGENTLPTIWEVARRDLGIPAVLPAVPPARAKSE